MTHSVDTAAQLRGLLCGTRQLVGEERKMLPSEREDKKPPPKKTVDRNRLATVPRNRDSKAKKK